MNRTFVAVCALLFLVACSTERPRQSITELGVTMPVCAAANRANCVYAPSEQDAAQLRQAAQECGLHERTLTFTRNLPFEYDIEINRSFGDPEERIECALARLPDDFHMKFGIGPLVVTLPGKQAPKD